MPSGFYYLLVVIMSSCDYNQMGTINQSDEHLVLQLNEFWPYLVTVLSDRIARRTSRLVKDRGLNLSQWRVLAAIAEVPGRTSAEVVAITPMDKGIVSRATKGLLEMGLIRREASQFDGRLSHLHLMEAGEDLYRELIPSVRSVVQGANEGLSAQEQEQLNETLRMLIEITPDLR